MNVAGWQMQVLEEQEVSKFGPLVVVGLLLRHFDFSEENILSNSVLIIKVPQNIISDNSQRCWHNSLSRNNCHRKFTLYLASANMSAKIYSVVCSSKKMISDLKLSKRIDLIEIHMAQPKSSRGCT